jgi:sulfatase maturation enzyme AslB (radical SAM superfamily)
MEKLEDIGFYSLSDERAKNASISSQMKRCEMIITEYCNFSCSYCRGLSAEIYGDRRIKQLSLEEIKKNIDYWCEGQPLENIRFSGGEPTLHKNIREIVAYAKSSGIKRIAISTNGSNKLSLYKELIELGVNDYSISLDGCCAEDVEFMAGGIKGAFDVISENIRELSKLTYVTVGIVLTERTVKQAIDTIVFADLLGVSDIRVIPAAQFNKPVEALGLIDGRILDRHPILKFRVNEFKNGNHVRGMRETDSPMCGLVLDDSVIAGSFHFPCVIYMREQGKPIGLVGSNMRAERKHWMETHNTFEDPICKSNCLDVCVQYCNKFREYHPEAAAKLKQNNKRYLPVI